MGIFEFMKNVGRKDDEVEAQQERNMELIKGNKLLRYVMGLGLEVEELKVTYDDGVATVAGTAASQSEREKVILALGNTEGVSQVNDQMVVSEPAPEATLYTVERGDSLSKIAKQYYGDPMKYPLIFEANRPMLEDPNLIYPGQVLRIPDPATVNK